MTLIMKGLFIINPSSGKQINQAKAIQAATELLRDGIIEEATVFIHEKKMMPKIGLFKPVKRNMTL